jgi:hypothetical protein
MGENGRPDPTFAMPVAKAMRDWVVANVVVHHVPHLNSVAYSYQGDTYLFNLQTLKWSSPARLSDFASGNIVSAVVYDRKPYITMLNGSTFTRYEFDTGSSSTTFSIVTPDNQPYPSGRVNILGIRAVYNAPNTGTYNTHLRTDFASATEKTLADSAAVGMNVTEKTRWFLPRRNSLSLEFTGTQTNFSNDCYLSHVFVYGTVEDSTLL